VNAAAGVRLSLRRGKSNYLQRGQITPPEAKNGQKRGGRLVRGGAILWVSNKKSEENGVIKNVTPEESRVAKRGDSQRRGEGLVANQGGGVNASEKRYA